MSWGHKISLTYGLFVVLVVSMVVLCMRQTDIHLVSKDYYKEEIAYQNQIDQLNNARQRKERLYFGYQIPEQSVQLRLEKAAADLTGEVTFFRPADATKDKRIAIGLHQGEQHIPVGSFDKGLWKVKIHWKEGGKEYLEQQTLIVQ